MENNTIRSGRADIAVTVAGKGPPLVFLHAGVADKRMWRAQSQAFAATHTTIAYDRRGFGETTYDAEQHNFVRDLEAVLAETVRGAPVLVGCSQGGRIAVDFALTHPGRVAALVLVAPAISGAPEVTSYPPKIRQRLDQMEAAEKAGEIDRLNALEAHAWLDGPQEREGRVSGAARTLFLDMNGRALRAAAPGDETGDVSAHARFGELTMPILFVTGELDFPHINERSARLARAVRNAERVEIKSAAHLPSLEHPDVFNAILGQFLKNHGL